MVREIRVVVVDDHHMIRQGLKWLLQEEPGITVVGEAADGEHGFELVEQLRPDVVVLDMELGGGKDGVQVARALADAGLRTGVLAYSAHDEDQYLTQTVGANRAAGYLTKDEEPEMIVRAIKDIAAGGRNGPWTSPEVSKKLLRLMGAGNARVAEGRLTRREREILELMADGLTNAEIAERLGIAEHTVRNHVSNAYEKIGTSDRVKAALWFRGHGEVNGEGGDYGC